MKNKKFIIIMLIMNFVFLCPMTVLANSSWHWISETRPYDVLPFVIILTLAVEILLVRFCAKVEKMSRLICSILFANILSFVAPYLFLYFAPSLYTFEDNLEHTPFYTVGVVYLLITLVVEVPIVYYALKKISLNIEKLLYTIVGANILTTVITAAVERIFCRGQW